MTRLGWSVSVFALSMALAQAQTPPATGTVAATGGNIRITALGHASVQVEHAGWTITVDPASATADLSNARRADLILVTDIHGDHLDPAALGKLGARPPNSPTALPSSPDKAQVVIPAAAKDKVPDGIVMTNGETKKVLDYEIQAVPMYNLTRGPQPGQLFHNKGRGNGYVITVGGKRLYFAGDTECVPEIKALRNIDVAFVPMNLPFTMTPAEAAECVKAFQPKIVYPYHFRGQKPEEFADALKGTKIEVRMLNWYPNPPAK